MKFNFLSFLRLIRFGHGIAINQVMREVAFTSNAVALQPYEGDKPPTEEWLQISPYGEFPNRKGKQIVTKARADMMVVAFNSIVSRASRIFMGLPIYVGHPDVDPDRWPDDRRIGKITALEARADGLYGKVAWNDLGLRNREQGYHVYPSPAWFFPKNDRGIVEPDELISVGMTNTPQIAESAPWTQNTAPGLSPGSSTQENTMKLKLIQILGLKALAEGGEVTDDQVVTAVNSVHAKASQLEIEKQTAINAKTTLETAKATAEQERDTAKNAAAAIRKSAGKVLLDIAVNEGRVTAAERPQFETDFESDFDGTVVKLAAKQKAMNTTSISLGDRQASIATAAERSAIINSAVEAEMKKNGGDYTAAYNTVARDPQYKVVFDAMKKPGHEVAA